MGKFQLASAAGGARETDESQGEERAASGLGNERQEAADFAATKRTRMDIPVGFVGKERGAECGFRASRRAAVRRDVRRVPTGGKC